MTDLERAYAAGLQRGFWMGFAAFTHKEEKRHLKDVENCRADKAKLEALGIPIPDMGADEWWEVPDGLR